MSFGAEQMNCKEERDCEYQPWCRIESRCKRAEQQTGETMTEERKLYIAKLATDESRARERYYGLSLMNTSQLPADEKEKSYAEFRVAEAEYYEARSRLRDAVNAHAA
jgi:hypothetical protein